MWIFCIYLLQKLLQLTFSTYYFWFRYAFLHWLQIPAEAKFCSAPKICIWHIYSCHFDGVFAIAKRLCILLCVAQLMVFNVIDLLNTFWSICVWYKLWHFHLLNTFGEGWFSCSTCRAPCLRLWHWPLCHEGHQSSFSNDDISIKQNQWQFQQNHQQYTLHPFDPSGGKRMGSLYFTREKEVSTPPGSVAIIDINESEKETVRQVSKSRGHDTELKPWARGQVRCISQVRMMCQHHQDQWLSYEIAINLKKKNTFWDTGQNPGEKDTGVSTTGNRTASLYFTIGRNRYQHSRLVPILSERGGFCTNLKAFLKKSHLTKVTIIFSNGLAWWKLCNIGEIQTLDELSKASDATVGHRRNHHQ